MEKDGQRFEFVPVQNQRPHEEQAESDNQNQRRGPLPLLEQPACLTPLCGRALINHPMAREKAIGFRGARRGRILRYVILSRVCSIRHRTCNGIGRQERYSTNGATSGTG